MDFETVIGLEIHVQMKTASKLFSNAPVTYGKEPNTQVVPFDMAFPGTMPVLNKQAVIHALRVCHALHMKIDDVIQFERKNYFYSDLSKGYQLTQEFRPIGKNGYLMLGDKKIKIDRLHIEEDTCKQIHVDRYSLLDYNRSGIPLIEIVTFPDIHDGKQASEFLERIRSIVTFLGVSDGKMEEGSIRCDVNISVKKINSDVFGTKVEIKNINSIANVKTAIDYEIERQTEILKNNGRIAQETRRFDDKIQKTVAMRIKLDSIDYKYYTDTNITPIKLSKKFIDEAIKSAPELYEVRYQKLKNMGLGEYDARQILSDKEMADYFDEMIALGCNPKLTVNWLIVNVRTYLNKQSKSFSSLNLSPQDFSELLKMIEDNVINNQQAKEIFLNMQKTGKSSHDLFVELDINQLSDNIKLRELIIDILNNNSQVITDYKNGKQRALAYVVGQVMKETKGKADPKLTNQILLEEVARR